MTDRLVIYLLLAGCLIFGALVLLELEPTATDTAAPNEVSKRSDTTSTVRRQPSTRLDELLAMALARPLFSSTRRPPQSAANDGGTSSDLADMRLTGIVTEPDHHVAIFAALRECFSSSFADYLTTSGEYDNKHRRENGVFL